MTTYRPEFDHNDLTIIKEENLYQGFFNLKRMHFKHKLFAGGESGVVVRELLIRGQAVVVIAYDPYRDSVVMVEQVRIGAYEPQEGSPWLLELIAGMKEAGESPEGVAERESFEEAGIEIKNLTHALTIWDSPGGIMEKLYFYAAEVDSTQATGIHGLPEENEDIRVHVFPRSEAYAMLEQGRINNAMAVVGLQWLELNYQRLQQAWIKA